MIMYTWYQNRVPNAVGSEACRPFCGGPADDYSDDDFDSETAEIRRMIELSGMISLECGLFGAGALDASAAASTGDL